MEKNVALSTISVTCNGIEGQILQSLHGNFEHPKNARLGFVFDAWLRAEFDKVTYANCKY